MTDNMQIFLGVLATIFDMFILVVYLDVILNKTNRKTSNIVYYINFTAVHAVLYALSKSLDLWFINVTFSVLGIFFLSFLYNSKLISKTFATFSIQVLGMLAEVLSYGIMRAFTQNELDVLANAQRFYGMLLSKLILFVLIVIVLFVVKRNSLIVHSKDYVYLMITPLVSFATIIIITFELGNSDSVSGFTICLVISGMIIINLIVYYLLESIIEATEIREKQARLEAQFEFQEQKYEQTSLSFKKISSIIHDTNKHFIYLKECINNDEKQEALAYLSKAADNIGKSYKRFNTGNLVIDALMSNAFSISVANNIEFKSNISIDKDKINIERYDLSVTLGNLLDNAVEACKKISNPDDKYINVSIFTTDSALVINIINSKKANISKTELKTNKPDKMLHGYGLGNIKVTAEKYGGTFVVSNNESNFEVTAILPFCNI
jgi:signal transduction histidine kinase